MQCKPDHHASHGVICWAVQSAAGWLELNEDLAITMPWSELTAKHLTRCAQIADHVCVVVILEKNTEV